MAKEGLHFRGKFKTKERMLVLFPQLSLLASKFHIEEEMMDEAVFLKKLLSLRKVAVSEVKIISLDPSEADMERIQASIQNAKFVLFFCYDAHLSAGTKKLLETIQRQLRKAAVVLLRDPYDAQWVRDEVPCVTTYGFRAAQIEAAIGKL